MTHSKILLTCGMLFAASLSANSYENDSKSEILRKLSGTHAMRIKGRARFFQTGTETRNPYNTRASIQIPLRRGPVTLRFKIGATPVVIEGKVGGLRIRRGQFDIGQSINLRGTALVQSGPPELIGESGTIFLYGLAYRGRVYPRGSVYIFGDQESLSGDFRDPKLGRAYQKMDRERSLEYQRRNGFGEVSTGSQIGRGISN